MQLHFTMRLFFLALYCLIILRSRRGFSFGSLLFDYPASYAGGMPCGAPKDREEGAAAPSSLSSGLQPSILLGDDLAAAVDRDFVWLNSGAIVTRQFSVGFWCFVFGLGLFAFQ